MRSLFITILILCSFACNDAREGTHVKKETESISADSSLPVRPSGTFYTLDTAAGEKFPEDTALLIQRNLKLTGDFDIATREYKRDSFDIYEKTTEGGEVFVVRDMETAYSKIFGTIFGEMGKVEFAYYLIGNSKAKLSFAKFTDIRYDRPITNADSKIISSNTQYEIYTRNRILTVLDGNKKRIKMSREALAEKEKETRMFFTDYVEQINQDKQ